MLASIAILHRTDVEDIAMLQGIKAGKSVKYLDDRTTLVLRTMEVTLTVFLPLGVST